MKLPEVSMICAMTPRYVIGNNGAMPWRIRSDMKFFAQQTENSAVVMGPKTFQSIGKPLKERLNIVLTTNHDYKPAPGVHVAHSPKQALEFAASRRQQEFFVIGGALVYSSFLPMAQQLFITYVLADLPGDTHFPHWDQDEWYLVNQDFDKKKWRKRSGDSYPIKFAHYRRRVLPPKVEPQVNWRFDPPPK